MPSSILNSDDGAISGTSGLKSSGGDDGILKIQNNGTDAVTVAADGDVTLAADLSVTGNLLFNSGYGSSAVAYGCRAWVNFDGTSNSANLTGTYSQSGTTVTVTITAHGYITGNSAYLDFTSGTAVDGAYTVTVVDANTFTVTQASRTTSGNVTDRRNTIRASGNVSSITDNGTGDYTANFTTAMSDADYVMVSCSTKDAGENAPRHVLYSGGTKTTSAIRFTVEIGATSAGTHFDNTNIYIAIFR